MTLEVIGTGFGRTGTASLKLALERLGFGPCYHMFEVIANPSHVALWDRAGDGEFNDWDKLFADYKATVDFPAARFWRELTQAYPKAKVIHTVRDPERWYESATSTIFTHMKTLPPDDSPMAPLARMARKVSFEQVFNCDVDDRAHVIEVFNRHTEAVKAEIDPARLLVYQVAEGWEPLCKFLNVPVPDEPFPKTNEREDFQKQFLQMVQGQV